MDASSLPAGAVDMKHRSALIDAVDVELETVVGRTSITIAELNALQAGAVLPMAASLSDLVELRLNGVLVARGELVAVGDRFGVRLTEVSP